MIKIGTTLTLTTLGEEAHEYRCKVVEQEGTTIYVDYPIHEETGRTNIFPKGTEFTAYYVEDGASVYQFETEIKGKKQGKLPMLLLHFPYDQLTRIQRREYVRVNSTLDISIHNPEEDEEPVISITNDISGGGLSLLIDDINSFHADDVVSLYIVLPMDNGSIHYINAKAKVIRAFQKKQASKPLLTLEFVDITEKNRQLIIRHCFEVQLRIRRQQL